MKTQSFFQLAFLALLTTMSLFQAEAQAPQAPFESFAVKGRNGWMINQRLHFGPFETGKVKRGWVKGYNVPLILEFSGAKEKLQFELFENGQPMATTFCLGKLTRKDLPVLNKLFYLQLDTDDVFSGAVVDAQNRHYEFLVTGLHAYARPNAAEGFIQGQGKHIEMRPLRELESGKKFPISFPIGIEFVLDGQVIGAVETLNEGRIRFDAHLDPDLKAVINSVACALLLRSELDRQE